MPVLAMIMALLAVMVMFVGIAGTLRGRISRLGIADRRRGLAVAAGGFTVAVTAFGAAVPVGVKHDDDVALRADRAVSVGATPGVPSSSADGSGQADAILTPPIPTLPPYPDPIYGADGTAGARPLLPPGPSTSGDVPQQGVDDAAGDRPRPGSVPWADPTSDAAVAGGPDTLAGLGTGGGPSGYGYGRGSADGGAQSYNGDSASGGGQDTYSGGQGYDSGQGSGGGRGYSGGQGHGGAGRGGGSSTAGAQAGPVGTPPAGGAVRPGWNASYPVAGSGAGATGGSRGGQGRGTAGPGSSAGGGAGHGGAGAGAGGAVGSGAAVPRGGIGSGTGNLPEVRVDLGEPAGGAGSVRTECGSAGGSGSLVVVADPFGSACG
jgi:hypothetical protein